MSLYFRNPIILLSLFIIASCHKKEAENGIFKYKHNGNNEYVILRNSKIIFPHNDAFFDKNVIYVKKRGDVIACEEFDLKNSSLNVDSLYLSFNTTADEAIGAKDFDVKYLNNKIFYYNNKTKNCGYAILNQYDQKTISGIINHIVKYCSNKNIAKLISPEKRENSFAITFYLKNKKYFIVGNDLNKNTDVKLLISLLEAYADLDDNKHDTCQSKFESLDSLNNYIKKYKIGIGRVPAPSISQKF